MQVSEIINLSQDNNVIDESQLSENEKYARDLELAIENSNKTFDAEWEKLPEESEKPSEKCQAPAEGASTDKILSNPVRRFVSIDHQYSEFVVLEHDSLSNHLEQEPPFVCLSERDIKRPANPMQVDTERAGCNVEQEKETNDVSAIVVNHEKRDDVIEIVVKSRDLERINEHIPGFWLDEVTSQYDDKEIQFIAKGALKYVYSLRVFYYDLETFPDLILLKSYTSNKQTDALKLQIKKMVTKIENVKILDVIYNMKPESNVNTEHSSWSSYQIAFNPETFGCKQLHQMEEMTEGGHLAIHIAGDALKTSVMMALMGIKLKTQNRVLVGDDKCIYISCYGTFDIMTKKEIYKMANSDWECIFGSIEFMGVIKAALKNEDSKQLVAVYLEKIFEMASEYKSKGNRRSYFLRAVTLALGHLAEYCDVMSLVQKLEKRILEINEKRDSKSDINTKASKKRSLAKTVSEPESILHANKELSVSTMVEPDTIKRAKKDTMKSSVIINDPFAEPEPSDSEAVSQNSERDSEGDYSEHDSDRDFIVDDDECVSEEIINEARAAGTSYPRDLQVVGQKKAMEKDDSQYFLVE